MSSQLLFTASSQKQFGDWGTGIENDPDMEDIGIENPNNYINDLRNTVKIPKNSEIAVVNCEVNRSLSFSLDIKDRFYWWFGELLDDDDVSVNEVGMLPFPILLSEYLEKDRDGQGFVDGLDLDNLTAKQYADVITEAMRTCICLPDFYRTARCIIDPATTTGRKLKFQITSYGNQNKTATELGIPDYTKHVKADPNGVDQLTDPPLQSWFGINRQNIGYEFRDKEDGDPDQVEWDEYFEIGTIVAAGDKVTRKADSSLFTGQTGAGGKAKREGDWDDNCRLVCRTTPLSMVSGKMDVQFNPAPTGWEIGLTRPQTFATYEYGENITRFERPQRQETVPLTNQCDLVAKFWDDGNTGTKKLHLYELSRDVKDINLDQPEGSSNMREIIYWGDTGGGRPAAQIEEDNMYAAGNGYKFIRFHILGNAIEITLSDNALFAASPGAHVDMICTSFTQTGDASQHPLPIGMNSWALYPLVSIPTIDEYLYISHFSGVDQIDHNWDDDNQESFNYPLDRKDRCNVELVTGDGDEEYQTDVGEKKWRRPWIPGSTFYAWAVSESDGRYGAGTDDWGPAGNVGFMYEFLYSRNPNWNGQDGEEDPTYPMRYKLLDDTTPADGEAPDMVHGIIAHRGDWGDDAFDFTNIYPTPQWDSSAGLGHPPNMARALGMYYANIFQTVNGVTSKIDGTVSANKWRGKWVVSSNDDFGEEPDCMLVEVLPFNHQSYNMSASVPSKMVYVVPKSDYNGRISGKMFHEARDRYYVSLNNPDDIFVNQIEVRFTDKTGRTTRDLVGNSLVTFHIQPARPSI